MFVFSNCPTLTAWFDIDDKIEREILEVVLTKGIYPHGRCCQGIQPKLAAKYPVYELNAKAEETEGFKIFLFDKRHFSKFRESFFEFEGDHISIGSYKKGSEQNKGFQKYRVQMIEEHHLEDDPNFDCKVGSLLPNCQEYHHIFIRIKQLNSFAIKRDPSLELPISPCLRPMPGGEIRPAFPAPAEL